MIPKNYHSALSEEKSGLKSLHKYSANDSIVLQNDINKTLPNIFFNSNVIYTETAWQHGYNNYVERAGKDTDSYTHYLKSIRLAIVALNKPTFIVAGKHALSILQPNHYTITKLHDRDAVLMIWEHPPVTFTNAIDVIDYITNKYDTVLDFCCGYGYYFDRVKHFIASDINDKCVYYVAKKYLDYKG